MIGTRGARVFFYRLPCDMRKQMYGLSNLVREELSRAPESGDLYLFVSRRRDMLKILFFDHGGYCLLAKKLEKGTFSIELDEEDGVCHAELDAAALASLLKDARVVAKSRQAA